MMPTATLPAQGTSAREFQVVGAYTYDRRSTARWIASHIWRHRLLALAHVFGRAGFASMVNLVPFLIGTTFDKVATGVDASTLVLLALAVMGARASQSTIAFLHLTALSTLASRFKRDAREEIYVNLLGKSQTFHQRQQVGDIMARTTNDVEQLGPMVAPGLELASNSVVEMVVPLVAIAVFRVELLPVPLLFVAAFVAAVWKYNVDLRRTAVPMRQQFGEMNAGLAEAIAGIEVVKGAAQESREQRQFSENARRYRDLFVGQGKVEARYLPVLVFGVAFALAFGHAMLLYGAGALTVGEVVAFMGMVHAMRNPSNFSIWSFLLIQLGIAGADRIVSLLNDESEMDENAGGVARPIRGEIEFQDVSFERDGVPVLRDISFSVPPGEVVAIVGQTGSGKTTLAQLVQRTYDPTQGRVLIDRIDVGEWSLDSLRSQIGVIEQDVFLFSRTIRENIAFGLGGSASQDRIEEAARVAQAHDFIVALPFGYDTIVGERGVTLSGGQRQRIAIARAFLMDPRILILDDSTSAIDSATEDQIQRAIRHILRGRTTLLITHRIAQIRWADRILVLQRGRLVAQGTHDALIAESEIYRRIYAHYAPDDPVVAPVTAT